MLKDRVKEELGVTARDRSRRKIPFPATIRRRASEEAMFSDVCVWERERVIVRDERCEFVREFDEEWRGK